MRRADRGAAARGMGLVATLLALLMACIALPVQAESLASVDAAPLPALPDGARAQALLTLGERPLVIAGDRGWRFDGEGADGRWQAMALPAGVSALRVRASAAEGAGVHLLLGEGDAAREAATLSQVADRLVAQPLPPLPEPLAHARLAVLGGTLYAAGLGDDGQPRFYALARTTPGAGWTAQAPWPHGSAPSTLAAQKFALYLTSVDGRMRQWTPAEGWHDRGALPGAVLEASARAIGQAHVLYLLRPAPAAQPELRLFHTITGSWAGLPATLDGEARLATGWRSGLLWAGADGGLRSAQLRSGKHLLHWLDWVVIVVYLAAMLGIGGYFYLKDQTASESDFFMGGRSIPFWVAGVSLYATNTSSISFIAIPAKAYETNWQYLTNNLVAVLGLMFVAVWIVPLLRRLDLMSVFSYLETRFHPAIRMLASALAIAMQVGSRLSVILFLPALAIATITGIPVVWSILIMGVFTILYTAMGGMRAVVWTDFVQVFVKMGGAVFAIVFILISLGSDLDAVREAVAIEDKTRLLDFSFDLTKATVWGFIFLVVFDVVLTFPKDQVLMQRTLATKSDKEAGRSIWVFAAIMIPGGFVFYGIGTALWMYYRQNPERLDPLLPIDATFPLFIAAELPVGVTGLIIAGIFAAAMSTLSSIINSVATLLSVDFYSRLAKAPTEKGSVRFAEWMTVVVGLVGIGLALVLSRYDIHSLFDVSIELAGLLGGGFAGAYTLGMFTRRANSPGVAIGIGASIALTLVAWSFDLVHPYFYLGISIMLCIVIGYVASLFFAPTSRSLEGLTIHTRKADA
ncbi:sodium:solute symporter [Luteimonas sp. FCS-9]|uniref:sodium:solute symporter n=1 Tax=Luteimonas sp. FCS-9 TaxID=1547516 RepID=UPI00063E8973|nr:sodium:solute symporter [Luteimonas sp. FCS-9]KLJ00817.1 sodium:solute symporter [Luteimonas sp. FCS-9]